jgi:hypothetical protein
MPAFFFPHMPWCVGEIGRSTRSDVRCNDSVLPKPADMWPKDDQHVLLGLFFVFSIAWSLEQCVMLT